MSVGTNYYKDNLKNKSFSEILEAESQEIYTNDAALKLATLTFVAKSTEALVNSLNDHKKAMINNSKSNDKLSKNILWLNIILGFFTIIGTVFGAIALLS